MGFLEIKEELVDFDMVSCRSNEPGGRLCLCGVDCSALGAKVQLDCINEWYKPLQQGLMGRMLNICVERCLVFELHDATECIAFSSRRNVGADVSLEKTGNISLEGCYIFRCPSFLSVRRFWLPLECENMKDAFRIIMGIPGQLLQDRVSQRRPRGLPCAIEIAG